MLTSPRTIGPVSAASPCSRALSRAAVSSGRRVPAGSSAPAARQDLHRLGHQGDQVVGAVGETGVVERAHLLGHPDRACRRGRRRAARRPRARPRRRSGRRRSREPVEVDRGAGEGHRGVQRDDPGADRAGRARARRGRGGRRCARRTGPRGARRCRPASATTLASMSSGTVEQQQVAGARDGASACRCGTPGSSAAMRSREASDSPAAATMSWPAARSAAARTAPTRPAPTTPTLQCGDHARTFSFQSLRPPAPASTGAGRCGYRTYCSSCSTTTVRRKFPARTPLRDVMRTTSAEGYGAGSVRASACWAGESGASSGSPTSSGRGARGSQSWVTWSTMCTPVGGGDLVHAGQHRALLEGVVDRPLAALALVAVAGRERRRVGPVRELVAVEVLQLHAQARAAARSSAPGRASCGSPTRRPW